MMSIRCGKWLIVPYCSKTGDSRRPSVLRPAKRQVALLLAGLALTGMAACKSSQQSDGTPSVIHYAMIPSQEQMQDNTVRAALMKKYLTAQLHIPVEVLEIAGYAPTIEAMRAAKVEIATFGPLSYIIASEKAGADAIVAPGPPDHKLLSYNSILVVPRNSPIHSIADLKAHAKNLTIAFVDPASTSGYLIPRAYLESIGMNPEKDFGKLVFSGSHLASIMAIKSGQVNAGPVMQQMMIDRLISLGKLAPGDLHTLWTSDPIPESPIAVRKSLPAPLKEKIQQALLAIP